MVEESLPTVGFIGVGEIARALVEGLAGGPAGPTRIVLSPRGARNAATLAGQFEAVEVAASNRKVVDSVDVVVLSVLPQQLRDAVEGLRLRPGQLVVSVLAGVSISQVRAAMGADVPVVRAIPLPPVAVRGAVTVMTPPNRDAERLFGLLGGALVLPDEGELSVFSALTGSFTALLEYVRVLSRWAGENGAPPGDAERFMRDAVAGLAPALRDRDASMEQVIRAHETPGGLNEQLRHQLFDGDTADALRSALDGLLRRVSA